MKNDQTKMTEDPLDALLREADEYIPDEGFTARVVTSLPPRRRSRARFSLILTALLIGAGLTTWQFAGMVSVFSQLPHQGWLRDWRLLLLFAPLLAGVAALGWGVFALANDED